jgi:hypothetical protein
MAGESGRPHRKLEVWQMSMALVKTTYELTREFPKEETYGLSSQMRRSAVSIFKMLSGLIRSVKQ